MHPTAAPFKSALHGQANSFGLNILQNKSFVFNILERQIKVDPKLSLYS
jgi:hypothetical protein